MADSYSSDDIYTAGAPSGVTESEPQPRRRSVPLILAGLLTIAIALAGLLGPDVVVRLFELPLGWLLVVTATAAGALLLLKPDRKRRC